MSDLIRRDDALKAVGLGLTYTKIKADIIAIPAAPLSASLIARAATVREPGEQPAPWTPPDDKGDAP